MSASNAFELDLLELIFNAVGISNLADDAASAPLADIYVSLHTADPGEAGDQTTSEATYGSYARVAVPRDVTGWVVALAADVAEAKNVADITFPVASSGTETLNYFGIGSNASGAGNLYFSGPLTAPLNILTSVEPRFIVEQLVITAE